MGIAQGDFVGICEIVRILKYLKFCRGGFGGGVFVVAKLSLSCNTFSQGVEYSAFASPLPVNVSL